MVKALLLCVSLSLASVSWAQEKNKDVFVAGAGNNDMVKGLTACKFRFSIYNRADEAIKKATVNSAVLLFAEGYPHNRLALSQASLKIIQEKRLKVYIEFPNEIPGIDFSSKLNAIKLERGIVHTTASIMSFISRLFNLLLSIIVVEPAATLALNILINPCPEASVSRQPFFPH